MEKAERAGVLGRDRCVPGDGAAVAAVSSAAQALRVRVTLAA